MTEHYNIVGGKTIRLCKCPCLRIDILPNTSRVKFGTLGREKHHKIDLSQKMAKFGQKSPPLENIFSKSC